MNHNHLDTLRRIRHLSESADPLRQIDPDLSREAGMDGNYGRLLMAARDLDAAKTDAATFCDLVPVVIAGCRNFLVPLWDSPAVEVTAARILRAAGYTNADAKSNAKTLALLVYKPRPE